MVRSSDSTIKAISAKQAFITQPSRPTMATVHGDNIPAELRAGRQLFPWFWMRGTDRWEKIPLRYCRLRRRWMKCRTNLEAERLDFDTVYQIHRVNPFFGVGRRIDAEEGITVIDPDDSIDSTTGLLTEAPFSAQVFRDLDSYTEISPSGTGVKIFVLGAKPGKKCKAMSSASDIEIYDRGRFVALTGELYPGSSPTINSRQAELTALYFRAFPDETPEKIAEREARESERIRRAADAIRREAHRPDHRVSRARAYIDRMPAAIQGQGGSNATYAVACKLVEFALDYSDAIAVFQEWNERRASPPWSLAGLKHKLDDAYENATAGAMLDRERDSDGWGLGAGEYDAANLSPEVAALLGGSSGPAASIPTMPADAVGIDDGRSTHAGSADKILAGEPYVDSSPSPDAVVDPATLAAAKLAGQQTRQSERPPATRCHYHSFLVNRKTSTGRVARLLCRRWNCTECASRHKRRWKASLTVHFMKRSALPFFTADIPIDNEDAWARIRKQIQRKRGQRVKIKRVGDGMIRVITTVEVIDDDFTFAKLTCNQAITLMTSTIDEICTFADSKRPIATSRAWKLPKEDKSDFHFFSGMPGEARRSEIVESIKEIGLSPKIKTPSSPFMPWCVDFHIPPGDDPMEPNPAIEEESYRRVAAALRNALLEKVIDGYSPEIQMFLTGGFLTGSP